jgi:hypothetical protein
MGEITTDARMSCMTLRNLRWRVSQQERTNPGVTEQLVDNNAVDFFTEHQTRGAMSVARGMR